MILLVNSIILLNFLFGPKGPANINWDVPFFCIWYIDKIRIRSETKIEHDRALALCMGCKKQEGCGGIVELLSARAETTWQTVDRNEGNSPQTLLFWPF